jgi:tetratricopeptide (TPR) repeat protein
LKDVRPAAANYYGGLAQVLDRDIVGSEAAILSVIRSNDTLLASPAYGAWASILGELGRVHEALAVLEEGIASDSASGNVTGRARKLLASAHLRLQRQEKGVARTLAHDAARRDRDTECLRRAGCLLARAGFPADARDLLGQMSAPDEGRRYETAHTVLAAEIALAEGRISDAIQLFSKADQLAPPIHPRDFLAHAWERADRIEEALAAWKRIGDRPSLVWVSQPDVHAPGLWTEALVRVAQLSLSVGRIESGRAALTLFLKVREHADGDSPQSAMAQKLLAQYQQ